MQRNSGVQLAFDYDSTNANFTPASYQNYIRTRFLNILSNFLHRFWVPNSYSAIA